MPRQFSVFGPNGCRVTLAGFCLLAIVLVASMAIGCRYAFVHALADQAVPAEVVRQAEREFLAVVAGVSATGVLGVVVPAVWLFGAAIRPVRRFLSATADLCRGQGDVPPDESRVRELGPLAEPYLWMARGVTQSRRELDEQVHQRTAELSAINRMLSHEVTQRTRAEEELRESLSLLEATLESTADGILVVDGLGKIKDFNRRFQELWHVSDAILESRDDDEALAYAQTQVEDPEVFLAQVRELYRRRDTESHGVVHFRDGHVVEYYSKPQRIGNEIVGRVWSFRDVTDKHFAQEKQANLLRRVAEINEELSHFAYVVSHDLKAPLRGIKLITEWLCADYGDKLGEEAMEQLGLLQSRVERMHNLIDGVLQYSRVGRIKEDTVPVDCNAVLAGIVDTVAPPAHIRIDLENELPTIECEKTRITQVFQNLVSNAVKYMDKPEGRITVGCVRDGDFWRFHVADNGPGIDEKHFERIFRIFQTLAPRDEFESTGVGLTLVKKIVEMYGGQVWVESEPGRGSTFYFTLPSTAPAAVQESAPATATA